MDQNLINKLMETFRLEAEEHLSTIQKKCQLLLQADNPGELQEAINELFRAWHSLKGAARVVGLETAEQLSQAVENVLRAVRDEKMALTNEVLSKVLEVSTLVSIFLENPDSVAPEILESTIGDMRVLLEHGTKNEIEVKEKNNKSAKYANKMKKIREQKSRARKQKVENEIVEHEEATDEKTALEVEISAAVSDNEKKRDLKEFPDPGNNDVSVENKKKYVSISSEHLNEIWFSLEELYKIIPGFRHTARDLEEFLLRAKSSLDFDLFLSLDQIIRKMKQKIHELDHFYERYQNHLAELNLIPFKSLVPVLDRFIRSYAHETGKNIIFEVTGEETEIDRTVLDKLRNPITHLLRNCVDHGIESPKERQKEGKNPMGRVFLDINLIESGVVEIIIGDDGAGIDTEKIRKKLLAQNILSHKQIQNLSEEAIQEYIFHEGFSTAPIVSDISGQGIGMTIVKKEIEAIGGQIKIESRKGEGTRFIIHCPVQSVTMRGIFIQVGSGHVVVPVQHVIRTHRVHIEDIFTIEDKPAVEIDGRTVGLIDLTSVIYPGSQTDFKNKIYIPLLLVEMNKDLVGLICDRVIEESEIIIKDMGPLLQSFDLFIGTTLWNAEHIVPILNVSAVTDRVKSRAGVIRTIKAEEEKPRRRTILVVEDSLTSRNFLKGILEASGYQVITARDGAEGKEKVLAHDIDAVVTDVEMPRMDG
ncbi:MAG: hybrid sensor histidine kinase/response regulator, partial [Methanobacteriota archaeon]